MAVNPTVVSSVAFFDVASEEDRAAIASGSLLKVCRGSELLSRSGQVQEVIGFVIHGRFQVKEVADDGRVVRLSILGAGEAIGWLSLVEDGFFSDEVTALESGQLLLCPTRTLRSIVANSQPLLANLLRLAARNIRNHAKERAMLTLPSAFQRICFQISTLAAQISGTDQDTPGGLPRQHEIATAANTTRETVSRTLQILVKAGVIKKTGHRVIVRRKDLLQRLANDGLESLPTIHQDNLNNA
jgi:CRP-like cAMP-binding protein